MDPKNLAGSLKVAILVQSLDRESGQMILNSLGSQERDLVLSHLAEMGTISAELVETVAVEFAHKAQMAKTKRLLNHSKSETAGPSTDPATGSQETSPTLNAISSLGNDQLFNLIKDEHPQTIAIILVHLDSAVASDILSNLPDEIKSDVAVRIAKLDKVNSGVVTEINNAFEEILKNKDTNVTQLTGGVGRVAEILNLTDEYSSELVLSEIEESDNELADKIKQKMFVFEDLALVDDRGFQKLLRKVETAELAVALKAASDEVKDKVFGNMSARAGEMLREEIEDMGPVRMTEVTDAQQKIISIVQDMERKGELIISGRRGDELIA
jgi:flagellar motor switch protein FliG